jgi:hypothetical protein
MNVEGGTATPLDSVLGEAVAITMRLSFPGQSLASTLRERDVR